MATTPMALDQYSSTFWMIEAAWREAFGKFLKCQELGNLDQSVTCLRQLDLRYFMPREMANLMCFPREFGFNSSRTDDSLNTKVVSMLIRYLLM